MLSDWKTPHHLKALFDTSQAMADRLKLNPTRLEVVNEHEDVFLVVAWDWRKKILDSKTTIFLAPRVVRVASGHHVTRIDGVHISPKCVNIVQLNPTVELVVHNGTGLKSITSWLVGFIHNPSFERDLRRFDMMLTYPFYDVTIPYDEDLPF